ncbi:MAG: DUF4430 domain-containing protein [Eubacterium sp.]|nr:DUF4430 domain-containing protein [Eubacterium sp.]
MNRKWKNLKWIVTGIVLILVAVLSIRNIKFKSVETYQEEQARLAASGVALNEEGQAQIVFEDGTSASVEELAEDTKEQVSPAAIQEGESGKKTSQEKKTSKKKSSEADSSATKSSSKKTSNKGTSDKETTNKETTNKASSDKEAKTQDTASESRSQDVNENKSSQAGDTDSSTSQSQEGETSKGQKETEGSQATASPEPEKEAEYFECSIAIYCYELAENPSLMDERFRSYIPEDGVILKKCKLKVLEGTTAYDVLNAACKKEDIPMVSTYTAIYDTYYVRSIGYLSEKAAGSMSGWVYTVNGKSPNVGSSSYKLKEGDQVVWSYTVDGQR